MNKAISFAEWQTCAAMLIAATGKPMQPQTANIYYDLLCDIQLPALQAACARAIQEQKDNWLPSVGLIRSFASEAINGAMPNWSDEWDHVRKLVRTLGYVRKGDAMRAMSPVTQQAVRGVGWEAICDSENISVQAAQFRMAYENAARRESDMRRISPELRPAIAYGPDVTPRIHRGEISDAVKNLADRLNLPGEGAA